MMRPETRQTAIGLTGLTVVVIVALLEGFNGRVTISYILAVVALISPQALSELPFN